MHAGGPGVSLAPVAMAAALGGGIRGSGSHAQSKTVTSGLPQSAALATACARIREFALIWMKRHQDMRMKYAERPKSLAQP